ncbi:MAG TPA: hypothetical protein DD435_14800 [Cyanobacteria bacterium UBA8530]|nr:hypothetical protein [Cyanobacteria bacterium UBA8530]
METFVNLDTWRGVAVLLNLFTFFFAFAAFSVGLLIAGRIKQALGSELLSGVVNGFLFAAGGLTLRSLAIVLYLLRALDPLFSVVISDLSTLFMGASLFYVYVLFERHLKSLK